MAFHCSAQVDDDCVEEGLFNAAYEDPETGEPVCVTCAVTLGLTDFS